MMELGASGRLVQLSRGAFLGRVIVPHILTAPGGPRYTRQPAKAHSQDLQNTKHGPPLPAASYQYCNSPTRGASSLVPWKPRPGARHVDPRLGDVRGDLRRG